MSLLEQSSFQADEKLHDWMRDIRRTIHQYPELSYQETKTQQYIISKLDELGIRYRTGLAGTGILATIEPDRELLSENTGSKLPCVALRADMDGLPVEEKTGLPFASKIPGLMHACGHDGHMAMLLGAAGLLQEKKLPGRVVLLFQPAEEGGRGALAMKSAGALDGVQIIFAGHIDRHFEVGQIGAEAGLICAFTDQFAINITGRGGHAARPHETVDSIVVASLLVMSIQTLVSREINPAYPSVVSVGKLEGGTAPNVIAENATIEGTIRSTHPDVRTKIINGLERMVHAMDLLYNAKATIEFKESLPPVINDPSAAHIARKAAQNVVGSEGVVKQLHPSLGGEDFAYYLKDVPGCLVRFGAAGGERLEQPAHSPYFDFDEDVLPIGAMFLAEAAWQALHSL